jgi:hypothetical protein
LRQSRRKLEIISSLSLLREPGFLPATLPNRLLKFGFSQLYPAFETGSVVLVECH